MITEIITPSPMEAHAGKQKATEALATPIHPDRDRLSESESPDKIDIATELDSAEDFPVDRLPKAARDLVEAVIRIHGAAPGLPGAVALGVAAAALGKGLRLKTVNSLQVSGNLYILGGAKTGQGKSIVGAPLLEPLREFQRGLQREHKKLAHKLRGELGRVQGQIAAAESKRGKSEPTDGAAVLIELRASELELMGKIEHTPRTVAEDATAEKLAELAQHNRGTIASISSDARAAIKNLKGRYRSAGGTDEDILLKGFSGEALLQDRISRASIETTLCFTVVWLTQLDHMESLYTNESLSESGLLPRFLSFRADHHRPPNGYAEVQFPAEAEAAFAARITELLETFHQRDGEPFLITAEPSARKVIIDYDNAMRELIDEGDLESVEDFAVRLGEQAWRVALVLHGLEHGRHAHDCSVQVHNALAAIKIVHWFFLEVKEMVEEVEESRQGEKDTAAREYIARHRDVTARDVYRAKQGLFKNVSEAKKTLNGLFSEGVIERITGSMGKIRYQAKQHPKR